MRCGSDGDGGGAATNKVVSVLLISLLCLGGGREESVALWCLAVVGEVVAATTVWTFVLRLLPCYGGDCSLVSVKLVRLAPGALRLFLSRAPVEGEKRCWSKLWMAV